MTSTQLSQDLQHLKIRYDTANAFKSAHFDCGKAALDVQLNLKTYKEPQQIKELKNGFLHPYQIVEKDKYFDDLDSIKLVRETIKNLFQLQS